MPCSFQIFWRQSDCPLVLYAWTGLWNSCWCLCVVLSFGTFVSNWGVMNDIYSIQVELSPRYCCSMLEISCLILILCWNFLLSNLWKVWYFCICPLCVFFSLMHEFDWEKICNLLKFCVCVIVFNQSPRIIIIFLFYIVLTKTIDDITVTWSFQSFKYSKVLAQWEKGFCTVLTSYCRWLIADGLVAMLSPSYFDLWKVSF